MMKRMKRILLVLIVIVLSVGADQITKTTARTHLPKNETLSFAGDALRLQYYENKGGVFSLEYSLPERWQGPIFTRAVMAFLGLLILFLLFGPALRPPAIVGLALVFSGSLSNLLDRIALRSYVIDFISIGWDYFRTSIFNVADAEIVTGLVLLASSALWSLRSLLPGRSSLQ
jgi:signal peptidase II